MWSSTKEFSAFKSLVVLMPPEKVEETYLEPANMHSLHTSGLPMYACYGHLPHPPIMPAPKGKEIQYVIFSCIKDKS